MPDLTTSDTLTLKHILAIVFAPPDRSKTFSSLTLSAKCPADLTHVRPKVLPKRTPVELDDLLWLAFDRGATTGMAQQGVRVPMLDLSAVPAADLQKELTATQQLVEKRVRSGQTTSLVFDTLSALDRQILYYNGVVRGLTGYDLYRAVLQDHMRFAAPFRTLPCDQIVLCHAKAVSADDTSAKRRVAAAGAGDIIPEITGQALNYYRGDATFTFSIQRKPDPQGTAYFFRNAHPSFEGKTRLVLPEEMPADWRVVRRLVGGGA